MPEAPESPSRLLTAASRRSSKTSSKALRFIWSTSHKWYMLGSSSATRCCIICAISADCPPCTGRCAKHLVAYGGPWSAKGRICSNKRLFAACLLNIHERTTHTLIVIICRP